MYYIFHRCPVQQVKKKTYNVKNYTICLLLLSLIKTFHTMKHNIAMNIIKLFFFVVLDDLLNMDPDHYLKIASEKWYIKCKPKTFPRNKNI